MRGIHCSLILQNKFKNQIKQQAQDETDKQSGHKREIESEVPFMDNNISWQFPDPLEHSGKFQNKAEDNHQDSRND